MPDVVVNVVGAVDIVFGGFDAVGDADSIVVDVAVVHIGIVCDAKIIVVDAADSFW